MNDDLWNQIKILNNIKEKNTNFIIANVDNPDRDMYIQREIALSQIVNLLSSLESILIICNMLEKELPSEYYNLFMQRTNDFIHISSTFDN